MSYLSRKEDSSKVGSEASETKSSYFYSSNYSDSRKYSTDASARNDISSTNKYSQYGDHKRFSADSTTKKVDSNTYKIGYGALVDQMCKRAFRKGFEFNIMVVGGCGLGKSTFINSLLSSEFYNAENVGPSKKIKKTVYVDANTVILKEKDVMLKLCLIDTPGFGDAVDNSACWEPVVEYIENRYIEYMDQENKVVRSQLPDRRVHACLYFIQPTGHSLKPLDIEFMKRVHEKVNIIPIIGKSDTLTFEECRDFKKNISNQLTFHKIKIYDFPEAGFNDILGYNSTDSNVYNDLNLDVKKCRERIPFAVIGSNVVFEKNGKKVRGRRYPWGDVEVENVEHNDYLMLKYLLLRTHLQDLKDVTNHQLYEKFRSHRMAKIAEESNFSVVDGRDPMSQLESERVEQESRIKKMEDDMRVLFEQKAEERAAKLRESEAEMEKRRDHMKLQLESQTKEFEEQKKKFEQEKLQWEEAHRDWDLDFDIRSSSERLENKLKSKRKTLF